MAARGDAPVRVAFVGCGYVAGFYARTLTLHADVALVGVTDRDAARASALAERTGARLFPSLDALLADPEIEIVVNLTDPANHHAVTLAALEAGKHVYSEKPLALSFDRATDLKSAAAARGLLLAGAPCSVLGECAQTVWKQLRAGAIGRPRLVYAELDDGPIHRMNYRAWRNESGVPWPWRSEFETGCILEHAAYVVTWLVTFFGPAQRVTSFRSTLVPEKSAGASLDGCGPDFAVACIEFGAGVVARLTCGTFAPRDRSMSIMADEGMLSVRDVWDYGSPVYTTRRTSLYARFETRPRLAGLLRRRVPLVRAPVPRRAARRGYRMDHARGVAELAASLRSGQPSRLGADFTLHVTEIVLAMQNPSPMRSIHDIVTTFEPVQPMPFAAD